MCTTYIDKPSNQERHEKWAVEYTKATGITPKVRTICYICRKVCMQI